MIFQMWKTVHETNLNLRPAKIASASIVYLDKHSTLDLVMVSFVSSIPSQERQLFVEIL